MLVVLKSLNIKIIKKKVYTAILPLSCLILFLFAIVPPQYSTGGNALSKTYFPSNTTGNVIKVSVTPIAAG